MKVVVAIQELSYHLYSFLAVAPTAAGNYIPTGIILEIIFYYIIFLFYFATEI